MEQQYTIRNTVESFKTYEQSAVELGQRLQAFAVSMAHIFPIGMQYAEFTVARTEFKTAYSGKSDDANDKAFSRAVAKMNEYLASTGAETFTMPVSTTAAATAARAKYDADKPKRDAEKAALDAKVAVLKSETPANLGALAAKGDIAAAKALADLTKAAQKDATDKAKELKTLAKTEIGKANPLAQRIAVAVARGDVTACCALIVGDWPQLAQAIASKIAAGKKDETKAKAKKG